MKVTEKTYPQQVLEGMPEGTTIYGIVRHVSDSGMSRVIDYYTIHEGRMLWVTPVVRDVWQVKQDKKWQGVRVHGVGMDMIFQGVYELGRALHNNGYHFRSEQL